MTTRRYFSNNAPQQTLNGSILSGATTLVVAGSFSGWPTQFPFFAELDFGTASAEIVTVTGISGTTATIVRGQGGTSAISHTAGATLDHVAVAQDLDEANAHTSSNSGVHGISGNVVGTSDAQTLSNKTIASPTITGTLTATGGVSVTGNIGTGGAAAITGGLTAATVAASGSLTAATVAANGDGTVTGVLTPKTYITAFDATTALGTPSVGTLVYLTAPTNVRGPGLYIWMGSVWQSIQGTDTGWLSMTVGAGFGVVGGNPPQARMKNGLVKFRGAFSATGMATNATNSGVGQLPGAVPGPTVTTYFTLGTTGAANMASAAMNASGSMDVRTASLLSGVYDLSQFSYFVD